MIAIVVLIVTLIIGVPIAYALGIMGTTFILLEEAVRLESVPLMVFAGARSYTLIAIPLFVLMGEVMHQSGIANRLIEFVNSIVGFIKGGLGMTTVGTGMGMAAISGSSVADAAALGSIMIPQMDRRGYGKGFAVAITSASATIAQLIPPSITMILFGVIAGVSISKLFIAGIIPGILVGLSLMVVIYIIAVKRNLPTSGKLNFKKVVATFKDAFFALLLPPIIIGGIISGVFTPTEAGGIGVAYSLFIGTFIYRELGIKKIISSFIVASKRTAIVILMVGTSGLLGYFLSHQGIPTQLASAILDFSDNYIVILLLVNLMILIAGVFIHGTPLIIMIIPVVLPVVNIIGLDLIQFGIMACIAIAIGQITPPVASVLLTTTSIAGIDIDKAIPPLIPMLLVLLGILLLVTFVPTVSLWLPEALGM